MGISPSRQNRKKAIYFMSVPEGVQTIHKLKYKLVEDTIKGFLVTWQNINWIGFSRHCKFWPVVFLWSNLWMRDSCDDSVRIWHYINYPVSYSDELVNLCWYCWGGGLYPFRRFAGVEFVWNIDNRRPDVGYTVRQTWYDQLLHKYVISSKTNQYSFHY